MYVVALIIIEGVTTDVIEAAVAENQPGFEKVPADRSAVTTAPDTYGFICLLVVGAAFKLGNVVQDPAEEPGNFCNPVGWGSYDDDMRNKEINNGRFAMFAALGIIAADLATGKYAFQQFGA